MFDEQAGVREPPRLRVFRELPLTRAARVFAAQRHAGQLRVVDGAPFLLHPLEVASLLEREGYPDHVIAAAVLHDVLEDTDTQRSELAERFGTAVSDLVAAVSDDPAVADEETRKDEVRERVRQAGGDGLALYAADKVSKVRELRCAVARGQDPRDAEAKLIRHRSSLAMLESELAGNRMVDLLRSEIESLDAQTGPSGTHSAPSRAVSETPDAYVSRMRPGAGSPWA